MGASLPELLARLRDAGLRVLAVDVTASDVRALGWHVTRLIVPGRYSNTPAASPLLGGHPMRRGRTVPAAGDLPLPYA